MTWYSADLDCYSSRDEEWKPALISCLGVWEQAFCVLWEVGLASKKSFHLHVFSLGSVLSYYGAKKSKQTLSNNYLLVFNTQQSNVPAEYTIQDLLVAWGIRVVIQRILFAWIIISLCLFLYIMYIVLILSKVITCKYCFRSLNETFRRLIDNCSESLRLHLVFYFDISEVWSVRWLFLFSLNVCNKFNLNALVDMFVGLLVK